MMSTKWTLFLLILIAVSSSTLIKNQPKLNEEEGADSKEQHYVEKESLMGNGSSAESKQNDQSLWNPKNRKWYIKQRGIFLNGYFRRLTMVDTYPLQWFYCDLYGKVLGPNKHGTTIRIGSRDQEYICRNKTDNTQIVIRAIKKPEGGKRDQWCDWDLTDFYLDILDRQCGPVYTTLRSCRKIKDAHFSNCLNYDALTKFSMIPCNKESQGQYWDFGDLKYHGY